MVAALRSYANLGLVSIEAVLIIDNEGKRVLAKYYGSRYPLSQDRLKLEKALFEKTRKTSSDILLFENMLVLYKPVVDVFIYVLGGLDENEIMLQSVLLGFVEAVSSGLKGQLERRAIMENLDLVLLTLDETIDDGIILETDPSIISSRVAKANTDISSLPIADQTLSQVWRQAQEQLTRSFLSGK